MTTVLGDELDDPVPFDRVNSLAERLCRSEIGFPCTHRDKPCSGHLITAHELLNHDRAWNTGSWLPEWRSVDMPVPPRTLWHVHYKEKREGDSDYDRDREERVRVEESEQANLISSLCPSGFHAPCLDLDFPVRLKPSRTPGHWHLYLEREVPWRDYRRLLKALLRCGLLEPGYYGASMARKQTFVRAPWAKTDVDFPEKATLIMRNDLPATRFGRAWAALRGRL